MPWTEEALAVRPDLRHWVSALSVARADEGVRRDAVYAPRADVSVLVRWSPHAGAVVSVVGPLTRARRKSFAAPPVLLELRLRAGRSRDLLGLPIGEIADEVIAIEDVWGDDGKRLRHALTPADVRRGRMVLEDALVGRLARVRGSATQAGASHPELLVRAIRRLDDGAEHVASVARRLGVSDRHLRRLFQDGVGMTPKHYARIARLRRALERHGSESWACIARDAGFHDQAHLSRDFRDLLRASPGAFRREEARMAARPRDRCAPARSFT